MTAVPENMVVINSLRGEAMREARARLVSRYLGHDRFRVQFARQALELLAPPRGSALDLTLRRCTTALGRAREGDAALVVNALTRALAAKNAKAADLGRSWGLLHISGGAR